MRDLNKCENFLKPYKCNEWIIDKFRPKKSTGGKTEVVPPSDYWDKANQICSECRNYKEKSS